jgi:hypothetical protein
MLTVLTGDLHLTNKKEDEYRWEALSWLRDKKFDSLIILGDITDKKDFHDGVFVNRVFEELMSFVDMGREVHILMGNHDYSDPSCPFFRFLNHFPNCYYHSTPQIWEIGNLRWAFFPHSRDPSAYWDVLRRGKELGVSYTLCHQVFSGAKSESGIFLLGCSTEGLEGAGKIYSGDVHVPQVVGSVEYIGAPYPIRFGDSFEPRMVIIDSVNDTKCDLHPPHIQKLVITVSDPEELDYNPMWKAGDQVKVVMRLSRSSFGKWEMYRKKVRRICERNDLVLCGIELKERTREKLISSGKKPKSIPVSHKDQFDKYCTFAGIDDSDISIGQQLLRTV